MDVKDRFPTNYLIAHFPACKQKYLKVDIDCGMSFNLYQKSFKGTTDQQQQISSLQTLLYHVTTKGILPALNPQQACVDESF